MRKTKKTAAIIVLAMTMALPALADDLAAIQKALTQKYALTTTTADKTDIVTAGCVLVLKKSNLLTTDASKTISFPNTYKNGRITSKGGLLAKMGKIDGTRTFVSGEKVWLTGIEVKEKEISFDIYTDAISDVRYRTKLNFPFEKDAPPTVDGAMAVVAEVFDIQQSDNASGGGQSAPANPPTPGPSRPAAPAPAPSAEAPPPPIAPPPPPPADPKEIKLGQTPDQVTANFGQPDKIIKLATKQIYVYKDMKVTFTGGKVTDVQ